MCPRMKTPQTLWATPCSVWPITREKILYLHLNGISRISSCPHTPCSDTKHHWESLVLTPTMQGDGIISSQSEQSSTAESLSRACPAVEPAVPAPRAMRSWQRALPAFPSGILPLAQSPPNLWSVAKETQRLNLLSNGFMWSSALQCQGQDQSSCWA